MIICLLNGLTDVALDDLGGLSPLEKAHRPNLDRLGPPAMQPPLSFGGHPHALLHLLGVEHPVCGRAALEAEAVGLPLRPGQEAFSLRFVSMGEGVVVDLSDRLVTQSEGELLSTTLGLHHLNGVEALLITEGRSDLPSSLLGPLSPTEIIGRAWQELLPSPSLEPLVADLIERLEGHEINALKEELEEPPVNGVVLSEGGGPLPWRGEMRTEVALYTRSRASIGVAKSLGLTLIETPEEREPYGDLSYLLERLERLVGEYELVIFEINQLWESTYRGDLLEKVKRIEWLDREWLGPLIDFAQGREVPLSVFPLCNVDIRTGKVVGGDLPTFSSCAR